MTSDRARHRHRCSHDCVSMRCESCAAQRSRSFFRRTDL
jgi:hypothetical protein